MGARKAKRKRSGPKQRHREEAVKLQTFEFEMDIPENEGYYVAHLINRTPAVSG
jgi:hypothetical protein